MYCVLGRAVASFAVYLLARSVHGPQRRPQRFYFGTALGLGQLSLHLVHIHHAVVVLGKL